MGAVDEGAHDDVAAPGNAREPRRAAPLMAFMMNVSARSLAVCAVTMRADAREQPASAQSSRT